MTSFVHQRHKSISALPGTCELVVACPRLQSNVNLARLARVASCCGARRLVTCGRVRLDPKIARDAAEQLTLETHRSLPPVLERLATAGFQLVGLEQTTHSTCLWSHRFADRTALVVGHERRGLDPDVLAQLHHVVEIPVFGLPHSLNVVSAAAMALYEYCRQWNGCDRDGAC